MVDNRAGGGGTIAAAIAARSAPDGHTLFFGTIGTLATNVSTFRKRACAVREIRAAVNRGSPLGSDRFNDYIEQARQCAVRPPKRGGLHGLIGSE